MNIRIAKKVLWLVNERRYKGSTRRKASKVYTLKVRRGVRWIKTQ